MARLKKEDLKRERLKPKLKIRIKKPGAGFVLILLTYGALTGLMSWTLNEHLLDRVQQLELELRTGRQQTLEPASLNLFGQAMQQYPGLLAALGGSLRLISPHRDGWLEHQQAVLLRGGDSPSQLRFETHQTQTVKLRAWDGSDWHWIRQIQLQPRQALALTLPKSAAAGELIELSSESPLRVSVVNAEPAVITAELKTANKGTAGKAAAQ